MKAPPEFRAEQLLRPEWYVEKNGEWHLRASRCSGCGALIFPTSTVCPRCWPAKSMMEVTLPETGKLLSWTTAHIAPACFKPPYSFGYADLTPTVRLFGQIEQTPDDPPLAVDMDIELRLGVVKIDEQGQPIFAYKFAPLARSER